MRFFLALCILAGVVSGAEDEMVTVKPEPRGGHLRNPGMGLVLYSGNGGETYLVSPDGRKSVLVPERIVLSIKARGKDKPEFTGHAFYTGSEILHRYDSETAKIVTVSRVQDKSG